ncbi:hypothetical protein MOW14_14770 (plasmid) [Acinetobacter indicus]|uniref:hypothetical protein n=1 Tax=Acinetobacter indicus TaxID=756892 RepID=UPI001FA76C72|nr:hypothetical protein [Acinetobacter indicus]UNW11164.1 hypothetical protein MOW14_14770 [Acinetobacter indicus]
MSSLVEIDNINKNFKSKYELLITFPNGDKLTLKGVTKLTASVMILSDRPLKAIYKKYGLFSKEAIGVFKKDSCYDIREGNNDKFSECYIRLVNDLSSRIKIECKL